MNQEKLNFIQLELMDNGNFMLMLSEKKLHKLNLKKRDKLEIDSQQQLSAEGGFTFTHMQTIEERQRMYVS